MPVERIRYNIWYKLGDGVMERVQRLHINDLHYYYEQDKERLHYFERIHAEMKRRLERELVLECLQLINCRVQVQEQLLQLEAHMIALSERQAQYGHLFAE